MNLTITNNVVDLNILKERERDSISDGDIKNYFGDIDENIIKYSELDNYKDIFELLPYNKSYKIILIETEYNFGHWCCLMRYNKTIEWFNSYGTKPKTDLGTISKLKNIIFGQDVNDFNHLIKKLPEGWNVIYNKKRLQKLNRNVNTCGRWCILRLITLNSLNFDLEDFIKFIELNMKKTGLSSDLLVCAWIY